jgi:hypothetical protein
MMKILALLVIVVCSVAADEQYQNTEVKCDLGSAKGDLKLALQQKAGSVSTGNAGGAQCKLEWNKLVEKRTTVGGGGAGSVDILPENSQDGLQFAWKQAPAGSPYTFEGEHTFSYGTPVAQTRVLEVKAYVGDQDRDIEVWPSRTAHAYKHQLKFTFRLRANNSGEAWNWNYGADGEMCIGMLIGCHASEGEATQERAQIQTQLQTGNLNQLGGPPESNPIAMGGEGAHAFLHSAGVVCVNDDGTNCQERVMNQSRIQFRNQTASGSFYKVAWCFPHFAHEMTYDPTIEMFLPVSTGAASSVGVIVGSVVGGVALVALVAGAAVCVCRRKKSGTTHPV